jgi:predicted XRE-type DNA-binding protein
LCGAVVCCAAHSDLRNFGKFGPSPAARRRASTSPHVGERQDRSRLDCSSYPSCGIMLHGQAANRKPVTRGSGNVFRDLGLADADVLQAKADLVFKISAIIDKRRLTQVEAAQILGVSQPKISALLRGHLDGFSLERIMRFLAALDQRVEIKVRPKSRRDPAVAVA